MALRRSTGLVNAQASQQGEVHAKIHGTTLALVDGGGSADTITDSGSGFVTAGFRAGDKISVVGATDSDDDVDGIVAASVAAGTITLPTGTFTTGQSAGSALAVVAANGGSFKDLFWGGVIRIYSGTQPTSANDAESGTLLVEISLNSGTFVPSEYTYGIQFGTASGGIISKLGGEVWSGTAVATGTAGWFRLYDNSRTTGASTTGIRLDGTVGTTGAQLIVSSTSISSGATVTIDTASFTFPLTA
jgi:hypothetical protein